MKTVSYCLSMGISVLKWAAKIRKIPIYPNLSSRTKKASGIEIPKALQTILSSAISAPLTSSLYHQRAYALLLDKHRNSTAQY